MYGSIFLPPTCKINYVNIQENYVNMQDNDVYMQDNYVDMQVTNPFRESKFYLGILVTYALMWHHRCKMQHNFDNMRLIYVDSNDSVWNEKETRPSICDGKSIISLCFYLFSLYFSFCSTKSEIYISQSFTAQVD